MRRSLLALAFTLAAAPVAAQQVKVAFQDGFVSVETTGAMPRAILAEWSKVGGTNIVNAERVTGTPLTLKLVNVPEAQALEIILRSAAGYMAAPRASAAGASRYDRILVMPTSTAVVAASTAPRPSPGGQSFGGPQRFMPPRPAQQPVEEPPDSEEPPAEPPAEPVFTFPQPNQPQGGFPNPQGGYRAVPPQPVQQPVEPVPAPTYGTPFGVVGAPMPGMIQTPPPAQPQPGTPARPVRPPGL